MTPALAESLGLLVWWIDAALRMTPEKPGHCTVLEFAPDVLRNDGGHEHYETRLLRCRPAIADELVIVDDDLVDDLALRDVLRIFLKAAFDPIVVGSGKAIVTFDRPQKGIVFLPLNANRNAGHASDSSSSPASSASPLPASSGGAAYSASGASSQVRPSVEITPEMINSGLNILEASGRLDTVRLEGSDVLLVQQIFLAMYQYLSPDQQ